MKKFNIQNYERHKKDLSATIKQIPNIPDYNLNRDDLIVKYMPLVENLAKKQSTTETAIGVLDITDLMQYGYYGLIRAVDKIDVAVLMESNDPEKTIKSFISKRVKGAIRRAININRGSMKIPEWKLNEIRAFDDDLADENPEVALFFNQVFKSLDQDMTRMNDQYYEHKQPEIAEPKETYNIDLLIQYVLNLMRRHLNETQYHVIRLAYGLDTVKMSAVEIANFLSMDMATAEVRVSQIKREALNILISKVDPEEVFEV